MQRLHGQVPWERLESLPQGMRKLLRILLRKAPAERPRDAVEAQRAIEMTLGGLQRRRTMRARVGTSVHRARRWLSAHPSAAIGSIAALLLLLAAGVSFLPESRANGALGPEVAGRAAAVLPPPESLSTRGESTAPEQEEPAPPPIAEAPPAPETRETTTAEPLENSQPPKPIAAPEAAETSTPAPPAAATAKRVSPKEKPLQESPAKIATAPSPPEEAAPAPRKEPVHTYYVVETRRRHWSPLRHVHHALHGLIGRLF